MAVKMSLGKATAQSQTDLFALVANTSATARKTATKRPGRTKLEEEIRDELTPEGEAQLDGVGAEASEAPIHLAQVGVTDVPVSGAGAGAGAAGTGAATGAGAAGAGAATGTVGIGTAGLAVLGAVGLAAAAAAAAAGGGGDEEEDEDAGGDDEEEDEDAGGDDEEEDEDAGGATTPDDTTPPSAPVINQVAGDDKVNAAEKSAGVTVSGRAEAGSRVDVTWGSITHTATATDNRTWEVNFNSNQIPADGSYTIKATATDAAGNTSAAGTRSVAIDTTTPTPVINQVAGDDRVNATEKNAGVTVTGMAEAGSCHIPDDHKAFDGTARGWI